jgi:hypothetical protein
VQLAVRAAMTDRVEVTTGGPWKRNWTTQHRERWGVLAVNRQNLRSAMTITRHVGGRAPKYTFQTIPDACAIHPIKRGQ